MTCLNYKDKEKIVHRCRLYTTLVPLLFIYNMIPVILQIFPCTWLLICACCFKRDNDWNVLQGLIIETPISQYTLYVMFCSLHSNIWTKNSIKTISAIHSTIMENTANKEIHAPYLVTWNPLLMHQFQYLFITKSARHSMRSASVIFCLVLKLLLHKYKENFVILQAIGII